MQVDTIITIGSIVVSIIASIIVYTYKITSLKMKYDEEIRLIKAKIETVAKEVEEQKVLHEDIREIKFAMNILLIHVGVDINKYKQV
jgi:uncharacterized protein YhaN